MKKLSDLKDLKGKKVLLRVDFNVPFDGSIILDDFRIKKTLPTIQKLREAGAKIILISHHSKERSIKPVVNFLRTFFPVTFVEDVMSFSSEEMDETDVVLIENLRNWKGEETNDQEFAKHLASLADIYVNESFSASHRKHASIVGVPRYIPGYAGYLFSEEVENLSKALNPKSPALFIFGGAKFETKLKLLKKFLDKGERVVVAGALMNNFYKTKGFEIGDSLVDDGDFDIQQMMKDQDLYVPVDVVVENKAGQAEVKKPNQVGPKDIIMDVGPKTIEDLQKFVTNSEFILWNGPLGNYEKGYAEGTRELAHRIAESGKDSIVGGGDTVGVIAKINLLEKFTFVSTAGGAMLDYLEDGSLVGIEAID